MIDPLEINLLMPADRTESGLFVHPDGLGLHAADKKKHIHLNYTRLTFSGAKCRRLSLQSYNQE